jgi:hypothetical protein
MRALNSLAHFYLPVFFACSAACLGSPITAFVRVNQVGYIADQPKEAILLSSGPVQGAFSIIDATSGLTVFTGPIPAANEGPWNLAYANTCRLDFSSVTAAATYFVRLSGGANVVSPLFRIGSPAQLYTDRLSHLLFYFQAQRDGPDVIPSVLSRRPSHLADETASIYSAPIYNARDYLTSPLQVVGGPVDVSGGWFDAGDYVKFVETASYVEGLMLFALRDHLALFPGDGDFVRESRFGLDWLLRMWDQASRTLYYQVGLTDGDSAGTIGSDHDLWRLPEVDDLLGDSMPSQYYFYVKHRPVFRAGRSGSSISPNLAGRMAAAFALGAQVFHDSDPAYAHRCLLAAQTIFDLAKTRGVARLLTTSPYDNYPEVEWRDDLEWGAAEIFLATSLPGQPAGLPHADPAFYLQQSAHWAQKYITSRNHLADSLNLYDVSALAHYELARALTSAGLSSGLEVHPADLISDLNAQLAVGATQAARDPFGLGVSYAGGSDIVPHALGYAVTAHFYRKLTGARDYDRFARQQRDWVLGKNAWGTSFIIGAGTVFPFWPQHQVANLAGSHDGTPPILLGAVVDGPAPATELEGLGALDGMITPPAGFDMFASFRTSGGITYVDNVIDWPTVEPANDYTIISLLLFASEIDDSFP